MMKSYFSLHNFGILIFFCSLQFVLVNTDENPDLDTLDTRLQELPKRLHQLSEIAFPDGIPESFFNYYTLPFARSEICKNHSFAYREALKEFQPWAVQIVDSSGKVPSGLMQYHLYDLGNFHECLDADIEKKSPYPVQHCVLQIGNLMSLPKSQYVDTDNFESMLGGLPVLQPRLHLGLCLPASCTLEEIKENYKHILYKYNLTVHLDNYSCTASDETLPFNNFDIIVSIILLVPVILCIVATISEYKFSNGSKQGLPRQMLECFSFYKNGKSLLKTKSTKRPLSTLYAIRVMAVFWIMFSHHWIFRFITPTLNYTTKVYYKLYLAPIMNGTLAVDTFILMSGLVLSYVFFYAAKMGYKFNLGIFYLHRIVRIVPPYFFILLGMLTNYAAYVCNGPLCKYYITRQRDQCRQNWWTNVLFINNYVNVESQCLMHSWYLSADIQFRLIAPIFLLAMYKYKSFIKFGIPICIVIANVISFTNSFVKQFPAGILIPIDYKTIFKFSEEHITTHTKLGPWFVGLGLGYILYETEGKHIKISSFVVKLCWLMSTLLGAFVLLSIMYFHQDDVPYNRLLSSSYTGFHSTIWAFCLAWVIFACETGYGGPVRTFLLWKIFQPLGKLTYIMFLMHPIFQYATNALRKLSAYVELTTVNINILGEITTLILMAPILTLIYEIPYVRLEKLFLDNIITKNKVNNDKIDLSKDKAEENSTVA